MTRLPPSTAVQRVLVLCRCGMRTRRLHLQKHQRPPRPTQVRPWCPALHHAVGLPASWARSTPVGDDPPVRRRRSTAWRSSRLCDRRRHRDLVDLGLRRSAVPNQRDGSMLWNACTSSSRGRLSGRSSTIFILPPTPTARRGPLAPRGSLPSLQRGLVTLRILELEPIGCGLSSFQTSIWSRCRSSSRAANGTSARCCHRDFRPPSAP